VIEIATTGESSLPQCYARPREASINFNDKSFQMAKWGEGDERWKVQELGNSGRNVNNWHWEESDALPWAKARLLEVFPKDVLLVDDGTVVVRGDGKVKVSGEAIINRRKGKVIPAYELDVSFGWKGTCKDGEEFSGSIKMPYISEENHDEDPEVQVTVKEAGSEAEKVRSLIVNEGRKIVYGLMGSFVKELRAGGSSGASVDGGSGHGSVDGDGPTPAVQPHATSSGAAAPQPKKAASTPKRSLEIVEQYYASSKDIYDCFTDAAKVKAFTGSSATIEPVVGGAISMFGGSIEGKFTKLEPCRRIEMDWRFSTWADGSMSTVCILLDEKDRGSVTLTLKQAGIPEEDRFGNHDVLSVTQMGWKTQILTRMKQVFGYGM
jgi:activator of HSP90 ATPase